MPPLPKTAAALLFLASLAFPAPGAHAATPSETRIVRGSVRLPDPGGQTIGSARIVRAPTADELAAPMRFSVSLPMRDFGGLQARIAAGERIPEAEMEATYRPLQADFDRVAAWLAGQGFTRTLPDRLHMNVFVSGSVSRVAQAFGVRFARVAAADGEYTSAVTEPSVPAELAPLVLSVNALQPEFRMRHAKVRTAAAPQDIVGSNHYIYVTPDNVLAAYNVPAVATGAGQTVAVLGEGAAPASDFTTFWGEVGSAEVASNVATVNVDGGPAASPAADIITETDLDVEWVGAMAPGAKIRLYLAQNALETYTGIANDLPSFPSMTVVSSSYGNTETNDSGALQSYAQVTASFAAAGVTVLTSSGDSGSNPNGTVSAGNYLSTAALDVTYPASDPSVTGVGGTTVTFTGNWAYGGEAAWNRIVSSGGSDMSATGGGVSGFFAKPSWQTGGSVLAGQTMRCVPDVSAISDSDLTNVILGPQYQPFSGTDIGVLIFNGADTTTDNGNHAASGTSLACPVWAGFVALVNQARAANGAHPIGLLNPYLYPLAGTGVFNDPASGNNGAYTAGVGYDLCTGLGSPNVARLITALAGNTSQRLANISTRAQVGTGANILIPGLYISGSGTETLLIRADGPALTQFGVAGALAQPKLSVFNAAGVMVASNTGWGTDPNAANNATITAQVGAFPLAAGSADCALVTGLTAGSYTVQVSGVNNTTGVALAEVYEVSSTGTARLANISTRAMVGTGANILIPGIYISGSGSEELLIRADGPALTQYGVTGVLAQPTLSVFNSAGAMVASNTGWGTGASAAQIPAISASVGAFPLAAGSADCALIVNLQPGSYTIQVSGAGSTTGVALAEVYEVTN